MPIRITIGDITRQKVCAVVNAANSSLLGGGGVDGAIHRAGGPAILEACQALRRERYTDGLPTGEAVATTAGDLPAHYVIHTVGPVWGACGPVRECERLLASAYRRSLEEARRLGCRSVAFPAISTGVYRFPAELAARIACKTVKAFLEKHPQMEVVFVFHTPEHRKIFEESVGDECDL